MHCAHSTPPPLIRTPPQAGSDSSPSATPDWAERRTQARPRREWPPWRRSVLVYLPIAPIRPRTRFAFARFLAGRDWDGSSWTFDVRPDPALAPPEGALIDDEDPPGPASGPADGGYAAETAEPTRAGQYWDGSRWLTWNGQQWEPEPAQARPPVSGAAPATTAGPTTVVPHSPATPEASKSKVPWITAVIAAVLILIVLGWFLARRPTGTGAAGVTAAGASPQLSADAAYQTPQDVIRAMRQSGVDCGNQTVVSPPGSAANGQVSCQTEFGLVEVYTFDSPAMQDQWAGAFTPLCAASGLSGTLSAQYIKGATWAILADQSQGTYSPDSAPQGLAAALHIPASSFCAGSSNLPSTSGRAAETAMLSTLDCINPSLLTPSVTYVEDRYQCSNGYTFVSFFSSDRDEQTWIDRTLAIRPSLYVVTGSGWALTTDRPSVATQAINIGGKRRL